MKTTMIQRLARGTALLGAGVMLFGVGSIAPSFADGTFDRLDRAVRHDLDAVRRDETRLHDLGRKRADQRYRGDWRGVRDTDKNMDHARLDLQRDRDLLRLDQRELDRYQRR